MEGLHGALRWAQTFAFVGLALVSLRLWWRQRNRAAAWAATTFCVLAIVSLAAIAGPRDEPPEWYIKGLLVLLLLFPYSLHRFMAAMVRPPWWVPVGGLTITAIVVVATLFLPHLPEDNATRPGWLKAYLFLILLQWTALTLSACIRMWLAGRRQPGLPRRRMRLLAVAALGLNLVIVVAGLSSRRSVVDGLSILNQVVSLSSAGLFYLAFAPPRVLRTAWRREEQQALQRATKGMSAATSMQEVSDALLPHVASIFGGNAAALVDREGTLAGAYGLDVSETAAILDKLSAPGGPGLESGFVVLPMRSGRLVVRVSAFTPIFGQDELEELSVIGEYVDLALDRVSLFESERRSRAELEAANEALRVARDEALAASQLKSAFLANMSHEIRTPMNAVIGMTSVLLDSGLDPAQREYAEMVRIAGESLLEIINGILDLSKIEAGRLTLDSTEFDLRILFEEVVELLAQRASDKGLELTALVDGGVPPRLIGDPGRLRQVLVNLVGNAVKFTEQGEVALRAGIESAGPGELVLRCEVDDTGIGIAPAEREHLFEAFYQVDTSDTRVQGGTGLGLAISRQLVELMGGRVAVESEVGTGSRFWFTVRLGLPAEEATPSSSPQAGLQGIRALVVDDTTTSRTMLEGHLRAWGIRVSSARDGATAMGLLRSAAEGADPYDVALVDLHMPGMDGLALAKEVRSHPGLAATRLVLLAVAGRLDDASGADPRIDGFVAKPVRQSRLFDCLATVLSGTVELASSTPAELPVQGGVPAPFPGTRILVVEDNRVNQLVATKILHKLGYRTDVVADGREAVTALSVAPYAAVLMDCQMPNMDGYEATAVIRQAEGGHTRTPIIAMTASAMEGDRERCLAAGMDDYVSKPVRPDELATALRRWTATHTSHKV
jgi:signal transduction histidine kinase/DNA-binding response OmpR family regulator